MADAPVHFMSITELGAGYRTGTLSPVGVTEALLERIRRLDGALNAYLVVLAEQALAAARTAEVMLRRGRDHGPLHGIPMGIKDLIAVRATQTTWGTGFRRGVVSRADATVVRRLREAGAIMLGKQNLLEFAMGGTDTNVHFGTVHNPWSSAHFPGGSSSGSAAAVAAGLCTVAVGTDTGGSVRQPASYCGISALKPTNGLVSLRGVFPVSGTCDTVGPMARSAEDLAYLLDAMAAPDTERSRRRYAATLGGATLRGLRVGVPQGWVEAMGDPEVAAAVEDAARTMAAHGARVTDTDLSLVDASEVYRDIVYREGAQVHARLYAQHGVAYGPNVRARVAEGRAITAATYAAALRAARALRRRANAAMADLDVLVLPTQPTPAPALGQTQVSIRGTVVSAAAVRGRFSVAFNVLGWPALSVPVSPSATGLPIGMQIAAPRGRDARVLRAGHAFQRVTDWHRARPPL